MRARSLLLVAPRHLEWVENDLPPLQADEVLVRTDTGAVSVGTELPQYLGTSRSSRPPRYPRMTGYESVGTVLRSGSEATGLSPGDRVVSFYGHRTAAVVSASRAIPVPAGVSDALALPVILSCDVAKGVRKLVGSAPDHSARQQPVLITGAGAIGLLTLFVLKSMGFDSVDVVEPREERRALAPDLGVRSIDSPEQFVPGDEGYQLAFECSARNAGFALLQRALQREGRLCVLSDGNLEPFVLLPDFHEKELSVIGSSDGWDYRQHAAWYFPLVQDTWSRLERLFDRRIAAVNLPACFAEMASGDSPVKVLVEY